MWAKVKAAGQARTQENLPETDAITILRSSS